MLLANSSHFVEQYRKKVASNFSVCKSGPVKMAGVCVLRSSVMLSVDQTEMFLVAELRDIPNG